MVDLINNFKDYFTGVQLYWIGYFVSFIIIICIGLFDKLNGEWFVSAFLFSVFSWAMVFVFFMGLIVMLVDVIPYYVDNIIIKIKNINVKKIFRKDS